MSRISAKIKATRDSVGITFKMPKLFVPVDCHVPATAKDTMARQLYQAGIISKSDFEKMLGVVYDGDFEPESEVFDDEAFQTSNEFSQSEFAQYEDFEDIIPEPSKPDGVQSVEADIPVSDPAPAPEPAPEPKGATK